MAEVEGRCVSSLGLKENAVTDTTSNKSGMIYGKLIVVRVPTNQRGFTRPSSIYFSLGK